MGHLPWHDGVGRRVGNKLRHIRKLKEPPDPKQIKQRSKTKNKRFASRGRAKAGDRILLCDPETPVEVLTNLFARYPNRVGGIRRTNCNSRHRKSREANRFTHYRRECGLSTHSHIKQSSTKQKEPTNTPQIKLIQDLPQTFGPGSIRAPITDLHNSAAQSSFAILAILALLPLLKLIAPAQHTRNPRKPLDIPRHTRSRSSPARILLKRLPIVICLICSSITTWENNINPRREILVEQTLIDVEDRLLLESKVLQSGRGTALLP